MADVQENHETPVVNEEVDAKAVAEPVETTTENGAEKEADAAKENGEKEAPADAEVAADADAAVVAPVEAPADAAEENGDDDTAKEANGDSTDSAPAESVKRKVVDGEEKSEETAVTPEKKAKLDEATKDDVQNGAEASEVAA